MAQDDTSRRTFLKVAGSTAAAASLAGCLGGGDDGESGGGGGNGSNGSGGNGSGGGGGSGGSGGTLVYARGSDSATLDPQATTSGEDAKVINQVYDTLIKFETGASSLVEGLATEYELDGTTARLTLREDATFHDGTQFTADDFVATYRRFVDEEYEYFIGTSNEEGVEGSAQSFYGPYLLSKVTNVEAPSDTELNIEIDGKYAPFLRNLAVFAMAVMPRALIEESHDFSSDPVGTGAFSFDEWDTSNQRIRLAANGEYWGTTPSVSEVVFEGVGENQTRTQRLVAGEADIVDGMDANSVKTLNNADGVEVQRTEGMTIGYMAFNMARVEAFRDKRVRKAINYAINTDAIVENIYEGLAVRASHPLPPTVMGHNEDVDPYPYDPEQAQSLLEEAGYADGLSFQLETMTNPRPYFASPVQTAQTVRSNLSEVGVEVEINQQSWEPYLTFTSEGRHDACFLGWISDNADPDNFYYPLLHPQIDASAVPEGQDWVSRDTEGFNTGNRAAWANTEFMDLVEQGQQEYDEEAREGIYKEASALVNEEAPWVFMTHTEELRGVGARVSGFTVSPISGPYLNEVSLE